MINGRKIREMREAEGLNTTEFSKKIYTSQSMVVKIELGMKSPSLELAERIAAYFGCSIEDLLIKADAVDPA